MLALVWKELNLPLYLLAVALSGWIWTYFAALFPGSWHYKTRLHAAFGVVFGLICFPVATVLCAMLGPWFGFPAWFPLPTSLALVCFPVFHRVRIGRPRPPGVPRWPSPHA